MNDKYQQFLSKKVLTPRQTGFDVDPNDINPALFPFQREIVRWACKRGTAALFEECGLGKTIQQLEWARLIVKHTGGKVIILAPLAVAGQTVAEGAKFGINLRYVESGEDVTADDQIVISNYDRLHLFELGDFAGVVLDESSILKSLMGKTRTAIIQACSVVPYRLACTATPAPNDFTELGNHAECLGILKMNQMLATWYMNDSSDTGTWRLKKHAESDFWRWLTSWAVCISRPADLGSEYDMPNFDLPDLVIHANNIGISQVTIDRTWDSGRLIPDDHPSSTGLHKVKRESLADRVIEVKRLVDGYDADEPIILWCDTDYEADALIKAFPEAVEVRGSHKREVKLARLAQFSSGEKRMIITKPEIAGFGLNWQHCAVQILAGVSFSFERFYQAARRSYRFGQTRPVNVHMVYAETEGNVVQVLRTKQAHFIEMQEKMNAAMHEYGLFRKDDKIMTFVNTSDKVFGAHFELMRGDCVKRVKEIGDNSIHFSVYSPPFSDLFTYSDHLEDMGNSRNDDEFMEQYQFLVDEIYRVTMPGRLTAVHCADLPAFKFKHGAAGLRDFSGAIIRAHESAGWVYHSRVTIWKDPVIEVTRTKAHGLLHKTFVSNATAVRVGNPDYLLVFAKHPHDGGEPVTHTNQFGVYVGTNPPQVADYTGFGRSESDSYSIAKWQRYASPVWMDIDQTNVLNYRVGRDEQDEKHICPLQLDVIGRAIDLWTNKGDTVFTPFAGIGSEVYQAIKMGRRGIGIELKESYWKTAQQVCQQAEEEIGQATLFDMDTME